MLSLSGSSRTGWMAVTSGSTSVPSIVADRKPGASTVML